MRRFKILPLIFLVLLVLVSAAEAEERILASKLTRLHIIANSDSEADQLLKLELRDALLEASPQIFAAAADSDDALRALELRAKRELELRGSDYPVTVSLGRERYDTRIYDSFALPSGDYRSLRVTIGDGGGKNWWCVLFPPLCFASCEELHTTAESAGLTDDEISLMTGEDRGYVVRFKVIELADKLIRFLRGNRR